MPGFVPSHGNTFRNPGSIQAGNSTFKGSNRVNFNSSVNPGHFTAGMHNHPVNPQAWHQNPNWWHSGANWNHGYPGYGYNRFYPNYLYPFVSASLGYPFWWSIRPYYGGNYYRNYYPYSEYYYGSDYGYQPTTYISTTVLPSESYAVNYEQTPPPESYAANYEQTPPPSEEQAALSAEQAAPNAETDWGMQYLGGAQDAFQQGSYADALRLANHAAIEMPQNAKPHELMSLAAFALKDYRGANLEAHAALSLGQAADWRTLYTYYGDLPTYTKQLDALVDYVREHKDAADARFVLAYHNLMMGHSEAAKEQFEKVLAKVPQDQLAAEQLKKLGGTPPAATPPAPPAPAFTVPPSPPVTIPPTPAEDKPKSGEPKAF